MESARPVRPTGKQFRTATNLDRRLALANILLPNTPGHWQAQFLAIAGMAVLPPLVFDLKPKTAKICLPDGLHFFRDVSPHTITATTHMVNYMLTTNILRIQNTCVRDIEFEIPIPPLSLDPSKPDLSIVQRAWWDFIKLVSREAERGRFPRTLELRIMGGSDSLMAPQNGNDHGTANIEVLTVPNAVPQ